jgi:hypothetical protein
MELNNPSVFRISFIPAVLVFLTSCWAAFLPLHGEENSGSREQSQFSIYIDGKEAGREKFTIMTSAESVHSSSDMEFREPVKNGRKMKIETQMTMDAKFLPQSYQLKTDTNGTKGMIVGSFTPGQAMFEIQGGGNTRKSGLLVADQYSILDSNIFHHFVFIVRSFAFDAGKKIQSFNVIVPQEMDVGVLRVSDLGLEKTSLRGKEKELHHLRADSGQVLIDLWVDKQKILRKIAIPSKRVEAIRAD